MFAALSNASRFRHLFSHKLLPTCFMFVGAIYLSMTPALVAAQTQTTTSLVSFGSAKYPADFEHFDYVNPDAPKGGTVTRAAIGTYDNFNRFAQRGVSATQSGEIYDTLFAQSLDEIGSFYPLIAEHATHDGTYDWMTVSLNPNARFQDGEPITADDVVFSFNKFMTEGVPQFRTYYANVESVTALDMHTVEFKLKQPDRQLMISLVSGLRIMPEHYLADKDFSEPFLEPPVGSSAYEIVDFDMGRSVTYGRLADYWAADLPSQIGTNNFDQIRYDYYRDTNVALEAFKAGEYDFIVEASAKNWAELYEGPNFDADYIVKEAVANENPQPFNGFVFNTERPFFGDDRVREALSLMFDFEWINKTLFYSSYTRSNSYFQNTEYAATGLPSEAELAYLEPLREQVPERVFTEAFQPAKTDGSGRIRTQQREALALLESAGWTIQDGVMTNAEGQQLGFEIIVRTPVYERIAVPFVENLQKIGVNASVRTIDSTQYIKRLRDRDFDMLFSSYSANPYPSPNLKIIWHSDFLDSTYNIAGVQEPAVDTLTNLIAENQDNPEALLPLGRALDRVLTWSHYLVPGWHLKEYRIAYWDKFSRPGTLPDYDLGFMTWWVDTDKAQKLPEKRR